MCLFQDVIRPVSWIEKLLLDRSGHFPNNYKLYFINKKLQFVYNSIDCEKRMIEISIRKDGNKWIWNGLKEKIMGNHLGI